MTLPASDDNSAFSDRCDPLPWSEGRWWGESTSSCFGVVVAVLVQKQCLSHPRVFLSPAPLMMQSVGRPSEP